MDVGKKLAEQAQFGSAKMVSDHLEFPSVEFRNRFESARGCTIDAKMALKASLMTCKLVQYIKIPLHAVLSCLCLTIYS